LRRRDDRMERPARVRIRRRKPWVLCRRRLFGWNVRLLTDSLHSRGWAERSDHRGDHVGHFGRPAPRTNDPCGLSWTCGTGRRRFRPANGTRWPFTGSIRRAPRSATLATCRDPRRQHLRTPPGPPGDQMSRVRPRHAAACGFCPCCLWTTVDPQARKLLASGVPGSPDHRLAQANHRGAQRSRGVRRDKCGHNGPTGGYRRRLTSNRDDFRNKAQPVDKGVEPRDPGLRDGTAKEWERNRAWMQDRTQVRTRQASSRSSGRGSWTVSLRTNGSGWRPANR
jgi:hypothetical protein